MRRIALYSDVHGNTVALQAVCDHVAEEGLTEGYCLGDLVGLGPWPNEAVTLVQELGAPTVQGNYDRAIGSHLNTPGSAFPSPQEALDGAESYAFTVTETCREAADYLLALPREIRIEEAGARILLCHGTPRHVSGLTAPDASGTHIVAMAREADADIVCCGHTHVPFHRSIPTECGVVHWVNVGSVGRPRDGDPRATWVELAIGTHAEVVERTPADTACRRIGELDTWLGVRVHRVAYDVDSVVREMLGRGLPTTLASGLRTGREEHDLRTGGDPRSVAAQRWTEYERGGADNSTLPCGHEVGGCTCVIEDRIAAYESLTRVFRGDITEVTPAVRRLRIAMRSFRVYRHVDEAAIVESFEAADCALRTTGGRTAFEDERDRLYGLRTGFDPFRNVLSPDEVTYLSGPVAEHEAAIERAYRECAFTPLALPEVPGGPGHIATELAFVAHCLRGAAAGDPTAPERARTFFSQHLAEWAVLFAVVVGQQAREPVMRYAGLALDKLLTCEAGVFRSALPERCDVHRRAR